MQLNLENFNISHEVVIGVILTPMGWVVRLWNEARKKEIEDLKSQILDDSKRNESSRAELAARIEAARSESALRTESAINKLSDKFDRLDERLTTFMTRRNTQ